MPASAELCLRSLSRAVRPITQATPPKPIFALTRICKRWPLCRAVRGHSEASIVRANAEAETLATWFPKAYHHLRRAMNRLHEQDASLVPNFSGSVYPMACANCGPKTVCKAHCDGSNYPGLPCAITAMGNFDADLGGHLILHQLRMYIRFAAGRTILLSSACIQHANAHIGPGETRESFTQYCPSGLLEWAAHDFKPANKYDKTPLLRARLEQDAGEGWEAQLARFSTTETLRRDRLWVLAEEKAGRV